MAGTPRRSASSGLTPGAIQTVNKGVQLSAITDPEGNAITFMLRDPDGNHVVVVEEPPAS